MIYQCKNHCYHYSPVKANGTKDVIDNGTKNYMSQFPKNVTTSSNRVVSGWPLSVFVPLHGLFSTSGPKILFFSKAPVLFSLNFVICEYV